MIAKKRHFMKVPAYTFRHLDDHQQDPESHMSPRDTYRIGVCQGRPFTARGLSCQSGPVWMPDYQF
jgi:hypothetical protein